MPIIIMATSKNGMIIHFQKFSRSIINIWAQEIKKIHLKGIFLKTLWTQANGMCVQRSLVNGFTFQHYI